MSVLRHRAIGAVLNLIDRSGLARLSGPAIRGLGAILMFHRIEAVTEARFDANRGLSVSPAFLDQALRLVRAEGYEIVPLDAVPERLRAPEGRPPFVALTFDDGCRDLLSHGLPVLERHQAPFTAFLVPGFLERSASLWWLDLEHAVLRLPRIEIALPTGAFVHPGESAEEKRRAFEGLYWRLRDLEESDFLASLQALSRQARLDSRGTVDRLCLDWEGAARLAAHPLASIGAHGMTHARLASLPAQAARQEISESRKILADRLQVPVQHFAYPVGDRTSAGPREFDITRQQRFRTALTTRPGKLFSDHAAHLTALPRLSVNGLHQNEAALLALLSGWPFALLNRGRKLSVE